MKTDRISRNDFFLASFLVAMLAALVLVAFAPVADDATLTMRVWSIAGSPITIATVSTLVAAFAGTWGAQLLAERTAARKALLTEIRGTNAALGLVFNITNTYLVTKKRHIRDLVQDYEGQVAVRKALRPNQPLTYRLELKKITPPFSPLEELRHMFREKIAPDGKAVILLTPLVQSVLGFAVTVAERNDWISEVRALPDIPENERLKADWFFGLPYAPGRTDDRYPNYITALKNQTDDCIAYGLLIGESLTAYAQRLAKRYGEGAPKIPQVNYDKATADGLMPDMAFYADWMKS